MELDALTHRKSAKKLNLPGHAHFLTCSCYQRMQLLTSDIWREWLVESIRAACISHKVSLWAYVFMPDHIHLLLKPRSNSYNLAAFEKSFKLSASKRIINNLKEQESSLLDKLRVRERPGKWCYRYWQEGGGHDKNIWSFDKATAKARYCHWNPVKRGLVDDPAHWRWSSYRWLELGNRLNEPLIIDEWDDRLG